MDRKGRIQCILLRFITFSSCLFFSSGCIQEDSDRINDLVRIDIIPEMTGIKSKALDPDEGLISDMNLLIFDEYGSAEECFWYTGNDTSSPISYSVHLARGRKYMFCACVNFGYRLVIQDTEELKDLMYYMAYPDEYKQGLPMYACTEYIKIVPDCTVRMKLERLMSKISLRIDRSRLNTDVRMDVVSARIGNCPKFTKVFQKNSIKDSDGCFSIGFIRTEGECQILNAENRDRISGEVSLYMLENMQGDISSGTIEDCEKVFDEGDPRRQTCSYIEMEFSYNSDQMYSMGKGLIYRFYLGEDSSNLDIERNRHYRITICPEGDGLSDDGWRVDKGSLYPIGTPYLKAYPSSYIRGDIGDVIHIWCDCHPPGADFDVGESYMKADKEAGIYDYEIDNDRRGATLTLTSPGVGLIYMEAGPPINDAALFIIEVNLPHLR